MYIVGSDSRQFKFRRIEFQQMPRKFLPLFLFFLFFLKNSTFPIYFLMSLSVPAIMYSIRLSCAKKMIQLFLCNGA